MIVTDERVAQWVSQRLGCSFEQPFTCMGWEKDGEIKCGILYNVFEGKDVHCSLAGHGWTRHFLREIGDYVYRQLGCIRMTGITESEDVAKLMLRAGGQIEGRMRNHFGYGRDGIVIGILKEEFRWSVHQKHQTLGKRHKPNQG